MTCCRRISQYQSLSIKKVNSQKIRDGRDDQHSMNINAVFLAMRKAMITCLTANRTHSLPSHPISSISHFQGHIYVPNEYTAFARTMSIVSCRPRFSLNYLKFDSFTFRVYHTNSSIFQHPSVGYHICRVRGTPNYTLQTYCCFAMMRKQLRGQTTRDFTWR